MPFASWADTAAASVNPVEKFAIRFPRSENADPLPSRVRTIREASWDRPLQIRRAEGVVGRTHDSNIHSWDCNDAGVVETPLHSPLPFCCNPLLTCHFFCEKKTYPSAQILLAYGSWGVVAGKAGAACNKSLPPCIGSGLLNDVSQNTER